MLTLRAGRVIPRVATAILLAVPLATAQGQREPNVVLSGARVSARDTTDTITLSLAEAVRRAAATAAPVELARLAVSQQAMTVAQARAALLPSLAGSAAFVRRTYNSQTLGITFPAPPGAPGIPKRIGPFNVWDARAQFSQSLFDPAAWIGVRAVEHARDAAEAESSVAAEEASLRVATAYIDAARAAATLAARQADMQLALELLTIARSQYAAGVGTTLDTIRAQAQVIAAQASVVAAQTDREQSDVVLERAIGVSPTVPIVLRDSLTAELATSAAVENMSGALREAERDRPELRTATATLAAARARHQAVAAERLGHLQVVADYGPSGRRPDDMIGTGQVALQYQLPIFDGGRRPARLDEQAIAIRSAEIRLGDLDAQVHADVRTALTALSSARAQAVLADQRVVLALEELREARLRFSSGVASNADVVTAQINLVSARDGQIAASAATALARARLARAVGSATTIGAP